MKSNSFFKTLVVLLVVVMAAPQVMGNVESTTLKAADLPAPRWSVESRAPSAKERSPKVNELIRAREHQLKDQNVACVQELRKAFPKHKLVQGWILATELDCALTEAKAKSNSAILHPTLIKIEKDMSHLFIGAQASRLRSNWIQARLLLLNLDIKGNRSRGWESAERLQGMLSHLDKKEKGQLYRAMGELAFVQQRWEAARDFFTRSLKEGDSDELRSRLKAVESILPKKVKDAAENAITPKVEDIKNPALEASSDELEHVKKITVALGAGELVAAVEESVKLIKAFPGGVRAKWASERVLEAYLSLIEKNDPKLLPLKDNVVSAMARADSERVTEWARVIYNRAQYNDSLKLAERAISSAEAGIPNARMYELAADSALHLEKYSDARKYYQTLVVQYGGTTPAREALLRTALVDYRRGEYISTVTQLERLLALPQSENYEVVARYWLWRSLQKLKSDQALSAADALISKFPFSYYGLRAQLEKTNGVLQRPTEKEQLEANLWMTATEKKNFERVRLLLSAGWLEEAQAELKTWPEPMKARDKATMALIHAAAFGYAMAAKLANEAWDEDGALRKEPLLSAVFPNEFKSEVEKQAGARKIEPKLISSLIKQESAYQIRAVSSSNAYGLMQMIGPTAKEVASELKLDIEIPKDLFVPTTNIQMGTYYLAQMLKRYNGHVPLALASYNAGPTRLDRWLRARPSLQKLRTTLSANPDDELWVDELPWAETSFYVKAILRNLLLYKLFEEGNIKVEFPVWSEGSIKAATPK